MVHSSEEKNGQAVIRALSGERYPDLANERKSAGGQNHGSYTGGHDRTAAAEDVGSDDRIRAELLLFLSIGAEFLEQIPSEESGAVQTGEENRSVTGMTDAFQDYAMFAHDIEYLCEEVAICAESLQQYSKTDSPTV